MVTLSDIGTTLCVAFEGAKNSQDVNIALGVLFGVFFLGFVAAVILSICLWRRLQGKLYDTMIHYYIGLCTFFLPRDAL